MYQCHDLQHDYYGECFALHPEHHVERCSAAFLGLWFRLYDEHVIYVLNAARINWRFAYLLQTKSTSSLPYNGGAWCPLGLLRPNFLSKDSFNLTVMRAAWVRLVA